MNKEEEIVAILKADSTLSTILTGGIYSDSELGVEGMRRDEEFPTFPAFDGDGILLPCAVVRQRAVIPTYDVYDLDEKHVSMSQVFEIHYHQFRGHDAIDAAKEKVFFILLNRRLNGTYPLTCDQETAYFYDVGPVKNSTTVRQDWIVVDIRKP